MKTITNWRPQPAVQIIADCDEHGHFHYQPNGFRTCEPGHPPCSNLAIHPVLGSLESGVKAEDCALCRRHWVGQTRRERYYRTSP